jgi:hypothetical protein
VDLVGIEPTIDRLCADNSYPLGFDHKSAGFGLGPSEFPFSSTNPNYVNLRKLTNSIFPLLLRLAG